MNRLKAFLKRAFCAHENSDVVYQDNYVSMERCTSCCSYVVSGVR